MECVDGETLEAAVESGYMTEEKARKTAGQLLDAMEYIHAKQTVHRDLKPSNIMLTHRGGDVKIIDFGLSDSETFCVLKIPAGTRGYMAPEQLKPGAQSDPSADIYSFGKVLNIWLRLCVARVWQGWGRSVPLPTVPAVPPTSPR